MPQVIKQNTDLMMQTRQKFMYYLDHAIAHGELLGNFPVTMVKEGSIITGLYLFYPIDIEVDLEKIGQRVIDQFKVPAEGVKLISMPVGIIEEKTAQRTVH